MHLYDLYRWKFVQAMSNNGDYWSEFVNILDMQYHESLHITDKYNDGSMLGAVAACIFRHCQSRPYALYSFIIILFTYYFLYNSTAFVANKDI